MNDKQLIEAIGNSDQVIEFATTPGRALILIAHIQLALRHPRNTSSGAEFAREMAQHLTSAIEAYIPGAQQLIEKGWNPDADMTREEFDKYWNEEDYTSGELPWVRDWEGELE